MHTLLSPQPLMEGHQCPAVSEGKLRARGPGSCSTRPQARAGLARSALSGLPEWFLPVQCRSDDSELPRVPVGPCALLRVSSGRWGRLCWPGQLGQVGPGFSL